MVSGVYDELILLLTLRRSAQFLGSFGKQWEVELPTFLLTINRLGKNAHEEKFAHLERRVREFYWAGVHALGRFLSTLAHFPNAFGTGAPFEMTA